VTKLCIFGGTTIGGYLAWFVVPHADFMTQFIVSGIGSIIGVFAGWKLARWIEER
jgi:hypothetical protein